MRQTDEEFENELNGKPNKTRFRTGNPGKAASSTVFFNTPKQEPGEFGKKLGQQVDTEKLICNEKEALQARLQEIRDKELEKIINVKGEDIR